VQSGTNPTNISMVPGFTPEPRNELFDKSKSDRWIFVGRLTREKGLLDLMKEWPSGAKLDVMGDGEQWDEVLKVRPDSVELLGRASHDEIVGILGSYLGLVFPGVCSEGAYPMVVREALARGVPILAAEGSSAADLIRSGGGGIVYQPGQSELQAKLAEIEFNHAFLSNQARQLFSNELVESLWVRRMQAAFASACLEHNSL
jgi:glycosyltransferase involved in cell wall biosynthesis